MYSREICLCLQASCKVIPAAQGSVLIFPDFHWPAPHWVPGYLETQVQFGIGTVNPSEVSVRCICTCWCRAKTGAKRNCGSLEKENRTCYRESVERHPPQHRCCTHALPAAAETSHFGRKESKCSVTSLEPWVWLTAFWSYVLHTTLGRQHYEIPNEESMLLLNYWTKLPPCCPLPFSWDMMGYYICD